jgi:hypothetical protein
MIRRRDLRLAGHGNTNSDHARDRIWLQKVMAHFAGGLSH